MHTDLRPQENYPYYPQVSQLKMLFNQAQYNKTHYEMYCEIPWVGVPKLLSKMNRGATMSRRATSIGIPIYGRWRSRETHLKIHQAI